MRHFHKISAGIDVKPLLAQLAAHPLLWDEINYRRVGRGTPHSQMVDIWVRYDDLDKHIRANDLEAMRKPFIPMFYPAWNELTALQPIVFDLMARVEGEMLGGIFLTKIPPGGRIEPHTDDGWHPRYFQQFYVSLKSAPGAEFVCDHDGVIESITPEVGDCWAFKNTKRHWVVNGSDSDRITAIIAIRTALFS